MWDCTRNHNTGCFRSSSDCGFNANAFSVSNAQVIRCEDLQASLCEKQKGAGSVSLWLHPKGSAARSFLKAEAHGLGTGCLQSLRTLARHTQPCCVASLHPSSWAVQWSLPAAREGPQRHQVRAHLDMLSYLQTSNSACKRGELKLHIIKVSF